MLPSHRMFTAKKHMYIENLFFWGMEEPRATKNRKRASNWDNFIAMESLEWDVLNNASDVRTWAYCIGWLAVWTFKRYKKGRKGWKSLFMDITTHTELSSRESLPLSAYWGQSWDESCILWEIWIIHAISGVWFASVVEVHLPGK